MRYGITKEQSKMLQGFAILMMLYHHLFADSQALGISYYSLLKWGDLNIELILAYFFKICVGIYAFVTGYGIYRSISNKLSEEDYKNVCLFLKKEYVCVLKKLFSFYKQFWLVFIIFVPIGFVFFDKEFKVNEFLLGFIGASSTYNGAWWYVAQYVKMLFIFPLIDAFFEGPGKYKSKKSWYISFGAVFICLILISAYEITYIKELVEFFKPAYLACFIVGYIISKYEIIELLYSKVNEKILYVIGIIGIIISVACRICLAKDASWAKLDFLIVPFFVLGFLCITNKLPGLAVFFSFWGSYNTYIWLIHVFLYDHYAKNIVMFSHISTIIYLTLVTMSLFFAVLLTFLYKIINNVINIKNL